MTSGGMYKYPVFEGTRISLSPKLKGSLKSFLKAILNIWEHCKYSTESSLAQPVVDTYNRSTPSQSGGKSYGTVAELQTSVTFYQLLRYGPFVVRDLLWHLVIILYLFTLLQSVTVYLFISSPLSFLIYYF